MDFFRIITPVTYWILAIVWSYIFVFYVRKLYWRKAEDSFLRILLFILAIDAFRTLFESFYFGTWFTSLSGLIPISIYNYLAQPQIVFIPKLINLITSILVLVIIIRKWLPEESARLKTFNALLLERTKRIEASKEKYKSKAKSSNEIAEHYRQITINSPFPIMIHAEDGEVLLINNSWKEITGYNLEEINTISKWTQKAYGENAGDLVEHIDKLYQIGSALKEGEFSINTKNGDKVIWDFSSAPLEKLSDGRRMIISTATDVTDKKKVEENAKESEGKYRNLIEFIPLPICLVDAKGKIEYVNDRFTKIFGYDLGDIPTLDEWWIQAYPDTNYRTWVLETWNNAVDKARINNADIESVEYQVTCKVGNIRTIIISGITMSNGFLATFNDVTERKQSEIEIKELNENLENTVVERTRELDGKALKLSKSRQALTFLLEDVNDIKKQLEVSNGKLLDANKELEAFSYSVSHDLKAPLRAVIGFSQILNEDFAPQLNPESKRYIGLIKDNAENMGTLIKDLLNFSRMARTELQKSQVDLSALVQRVKSELILDIQDRELIINVMDMPMVKADEKLMYHVILNLISNAVKFTGKVENAIVEIGCNSDNKKNIFYIKDNGIGFDMKYSGKIFDVFQRLHTVDEFPGTGIGLSIVQRIIHKHEGEIWVESEKNKGTTFFFTV